jgi:hypothetical protein
VCGALGETKLLGGAKESATGRNINYNFDK